MKQSKPRDNQSVGEDVCPECDRQLSTRQGMMIHYASEHGESYHTRRLRDKYGVPVPWLLTTLHWELERPTTQIAEQLGTTPDWVRDRLDETDRGRRGVSEAQKLVWDERGPDEKEAQLRDAHKKVVESTESGDNPLLKWIEQNPDALSENAPQENLWHNNPDIDANPMEGSTGPESPNWRGGKSVYDAVKKCISDESWANIRNRVRSESEGCRMCGDSIEEAHSIDVHHIVPLLCGGTNGDWNLLALCRSCHAKVERVTRNLFDPVLVEDRW